MPSSQSPSNRGAGPLSPTSVVVAVGTDHHPFDRLVRWIDSWSGANPDVAILVQRGTSAATAHCASVELLPHHELCERFAKAIAVVSHGGPSTVMDARMAGRLPIVVARDPRNDEHVDDHQLLFAEHLRRHDLARVVDSEAEFLAVLDEVVAEPDHFAVPVDNSTITGVAEFARVMDRLLGVETPLVPMSPAGVTAPAGPVPSVGLERTGG